MYSGEEKFHFERNYVRVVHKINPFFAIKNYNVTLFIPSVREFIYLLQTIFHISYTVIPTYSFTTPMRCHNYFVALVPFLPST